MSKAQEGQGEMRQKWCLGNSKSENVTVRMYEV